MTDKLIGAFGIAGSATGVAVAAAPVGVAVAPDGRPGPHAAANAMALAPVRNRLRSTLSSANFFLLGLPCGWPSPEPAETLLSSGRVLQERTCNSWKGLLGCARASDPCGGGRWSDGWTAESSCDSWALPPARPRSR